jgi:multicomponent Na+:H+ antiporter subunit G
MSALSFFVSLIGLLFIFVALLGILRMKDPLQRLQVASKASTLGVIFCLSALLTTGLRLEDHLKCLLAIVFIFFTSPIAVQAIAMAAYRKEQVKLHLKRDDLR